VRTFDTVEELRVALLEYKDRYNRGWLCERHGYQTPVQVRARLLGRAGREGGRAARARAVEAPGSILRRGGRSLGIPQNPGQPAPPPVTINPVSTKSGQVQHRLLFVYTPTDLTSWSIIHP